VARVVAHVDQRVGFDRRAARTDGDLVDAPALRGDRIVGRLVFHRDVIGRRHQHILLHQLRLARNRRRFFPRQLGGEHLRDHPFWLEREGGNQPQASRDQEQRRDVNRRDQTHST